MLSNFVFWPSIAGAVFLTAGLVICRRDLQIGTSIDKLIALGGVFVAAPLAAFGAEHLVAGGRIAAIVPPYLPMRTFWVYFVGMALIAAAVSLVARRYLRLSLPLLALMFFLFVLMAHIPNAIRARTGLLWTVALRDACFAAGPLALAAAMWKDSLRGRAYVLIGIARVLVAVALVFFAVEYIFHPQLTLGLPLGKEEPGWLPMPHVLACLGAALLIVCAGAILINRYARLAAACVGLWMTLVTVLLYAPIWAMDPRALQVEGLNYVADTLLFGGIMLLLAQALPPGAPFMRKLHRA
ncbi:MAG TPA: hypothetical protein VGD64_01525 [Acidisarcina sp.]